MGRHCQEPITAKKGGPPTMKVQVIDHPLIKHKLSIMRDKETSTTKFRQICHELSMLMAYEVTRDLSLSLKEIQTPLMTMQAPMLEGKKLVIVSILRAGNGILDGILALIPTARVGHIGLYRDPKTLQAIEYYCKLPSQLEDRDMLVVDPMLATGHSAIAALDKLKVHNPLSMKFLCLLAAPEGIKAVNEAHPDIPIYTAAVDEKLNEKGYIIPGLGDAGDRLYGTK